MKLGLGTALALLGAAVLLALALHGWWNMRRARARMAEDSASFGRQSEPASHEADPTAAAKHPQPESRA